jgi:hypothetical protein
MVNQGEAMIGKQIDYVFLKVPMAEDFRALPLL